MRLKPKLLLPSLSPEEGLDSAHPLDSKPQCLGYSMAFQAGPHQELCAGHLHSRAGPLLPSIPPVMWALRCWRAMFDLKKMKELFSDVPQEWHFQPWRSGGISEQLIGRSGGSFPRICTRWHGAGGGFLAEEETPCGNCQGTVGKWSLDGSQPPDPRK